MSISQAIGIVASLLAGILPVAAQYPEIVTVHTFTGAKSDGANPMSGLTAGVNVFYGTTQEGGANGMGTVYQLTPADGGGWTESLIYSFKGPSAGDARSPYSGAVIGGDGSLYGTTYYGGTGKNCAADSLGCGAVYQLSPPSAPGREWTEAVLYSFGSYAGDGYAPWGGLVLGANGSLYGTTQFGGIDSATTNGYGVVFEMTPPASPSGAWTESVIYSFQGSPDGYGSVTSLVAGPGGELYGVTPAGGSSDDGVVFRLTPPSAPGGAWVEDILHNFSGAPPDGGDPNAAPIIGSHGELYGTTGNTGSVFCTAFELAPSGGSWTMSVLHTFTSRRKGDGGFFPVGLTFGQAGVLYGATYDGGSGGRGNLYQLKPDPFERTWIHTVLASFDGTNGAEVNGGLVIDPNTVLWGTTHHGGADGQNLGTIFQLL